jgi:hypothetical protein
VELIGPRRIDKITPEPALPDPDDLMPLLYPGDLMWWRLHGGINTTEGECIVTYGGTYFYLRVRKLYPRRLYITTSPGQIMRRHDIDASVLDFTVDDEIREACYRVSEFRNVLVPDAIESAPVLDTYLIASPRAAAKLLDYCSAYSGPLFRKRPRMEDDGSSSSDNERPPKKQKSAHTPDPNQAF